MELQAKDLMLGNQIHLIGKRDITVSPLILVDVFENPKNYNPIPLTEEWLIKFGFEKGCSGNYLMESGRQSLIIEREFNYGDDFLPLYQDDIGCGFNPLQWLTYVHQLQNLYYCLTGQELEIKE